jgi:hypothetical protein
VAEQKRFNWEVWKDRFVRGGDDVTLITLSEFPDAPAYRTIKIRAAREGWTQARKDFRNQTKTRTREIVVDTLAQVKARQAELGKSFMALAVQALQAMPKTSEDLKKLKVRDIIALAQLGADLELRAMGIEIIDLNLGSIGDVSKLTDAEIQSLRERIRRARMGLGISPGEPAEARELN